MLNKENWKEEHLMKMHLENYNWCPLCVVRKDGEGQVAENLGINVAESIKSKDIGPGQVHKHTVMNGKCTICNKTILEIYNNAG